MALKSDPAAVARALTKIDGVKTVTRGWPKKPDALPCIAVALSGESTAMACDDASYLTEVEYYIRVFAQKRTECDRIANEADDVLAALGYTRTFAWEDQGETCRTDLRYTITV